MSKVKVLGLAAGALLLFGVQQIAGAATAAAQDNPAGPGRPARRKRPITACHCAARRQHLWKPGRYRTRARCEPRVLWGGGPASPLRATLLPVPWILRRAGLRPSLLCASLLSGAPGCGQRILWCDGLLLSVLRASLLPGRPGYRHRNLWCSGLLPTILCASLLSGPPRFGPRILRCSGLSDRQHRSHQLGFCTNQLGRQLC